MTTKRLMIGMLPLDHQRSDLFRILNEISFQLWLNRPCKHGRKGVCDDCDLEDYRLNGFVLGIEDEDAA